MHPFADNEADNEATGDAAVALLRPLVADPVTPSTVDIDRAVRDGRRRRRRRTVARATAIAAATGLVLAGGPVAFTTLRGPANRPDTTAASPAPSVSTEPTRRSPITTPAPTPPTRCQFNRLPTPQGHYQTMVAGADPTGRYVVGRSYAQGGTRQLVMWRDGALRRLPISGADPMLADVNSSGTAVGYRVDTSEPVPFVYHDGTEKKLAPRGKAHAINEAGTIVGSDGGLQPAEGRPVRWANADSAPEPLPMPAGFSSGHAVDIDEDGTIVGVLHRDNDYIPYVWYPDGTHRELNRPGSIEDAARFGFVAGIRNGWAVGVLRRAKTSGGEMVQMRWNVNTGETTVLTGLVDAGAHAVNAHGWVAGQQADGKAVLVTPAGRVELPGFPGITGFLSVSWVADDGRTLVGNAMDATNYQRPVMWRCS